ncbi:hypothetical protein AKAW_10921 [Aspergillus luchuensis IFO 4308]|nr:hypothetical protein AKAW_10921 [Aspergillus luchuensis IFO 4308]
MLDSQTVSPRQRGTAVLILMVLALGARYASEEQISRIDISRHDVTSLQETLLSHIRSQFFDVLDTGGVECVQLCILLSTYHLYNGKPNLAMPILGAGIRSAQAQGLHKESLWGPATDIVLEIRKRTWWALYALERLYSIAGPIISDIYDLNASNLEAVMMQAAEINTKLVEWFDGLPVELRIERHARLDTSHLTSAETEVCQLFQLQALVLQLAYDNIQIVLHRPFVRYTRCLPLSPGWRNSDARPTSFEQCKHCARRTCSILPRYSKVLLAAQSTHAAAYIAIQNFTAGVTLGMVALSDPGSEQSLDAKRGVANSIALQKTLAASSVVSSQTVRVLEGLFRLIFKREMQTLLDNSPLHMNSPSPKNSLPTSTNDYHHETYQDTNQLNPHASDSFNQPFGTQENTQLLSRNQGALNVSQDTPEARTVVDPDVGQDVATLPCYPEIDRALEAVQQVMWENCDTMAHASSRAMDTTSSSFADAGQQTLATDFIEPGNAFQPTTLTASVADPASHDLNTLHNSLIGQSWVWNQTDLSQ